MTKPGFALSAVAAAAVLIVALAATSAAQSPSAVPSTNPAASGVAPSGAPIVTPVGPITWTRVTKGKDFTSNPAIYSVSQLPDGRLVVIGSVGDSAGQLTGAAWISSDGKKWARLKIKAPKGSTINAVATLGSTFVMTGADLDGADGGGLLWTSSDGSTWTSAEPPSGVIYEIFATAGGLIGVGVENGSAALWLTTDGLTWQEQSLAPSGYAVHVDVDPDGMIVVAGNVTDADGNAAPTVWTTSDGTTWAQETLAGLAPGPWSVPAMLRTPLGYVLSLTDQGQSGGSIGHIWVSPDGVSWQETLVDDAGTLSVVGTAGIDALLIGHGQVLRSADGLAWTPTDEPSFAGWHVWDLVTLADGRLFAAGDAYVGQGFESAMAVWIGKAAPAS